MPLATNIAIQTTDRERFGFRAALLSNIPLALQAVSVCRCCTVTCSSVGWSGCVGRVPENLIFPVLLSHHQKCIFWGVIITSDLLSLLGSCGRLHKYKYTSMNNMIQVANFTILAKTIMHY